MPSTSDFISYQNNCNGEFDWVISIIIDHNTSISPASSEVVDDFVWIAFLGGSWSTSTDEDCIEQSITLNSTILRQFM